jgi:aconitase A
VIGFRLTGALPAGATATDLVLTVTQMLRRKGVVNKFVEFFGDGLAGLSVADRATIGNMAPEYGATIGLFPVDEQTLAYLRLTGRPEAQISLIEAYMKAQGMFRTDGSPDPIFTDILELDLAEVRPSLAGPSRTSAGNWLRKSAGNPHPIRLRPRSNAGSARAAIPRSRPTSAAPHLMIWVRSWLIRLSPMTRARFRSVTARW